MKRCKKTWQLALSSLLLGMWLCAGMAYGQSSTNYLIAWDVFDNGGGSGNSGNYTLASSIGQLSGGMSASANYTNSAGFGNTGFSNGASPQYAFTLVKQGAGTVTINSVDSGAEFTKVYDTGTILTLHAVANADSDFSGWTGGECTSTGDCTVTVNRDIVITALFTLKSYTITACAGAGGSITPEGTVTVNYGVNQAFIITPNAGYEIANVLVDNAPVEALTTYAETQGDTTITKATLTFTHVTANHTLAATFSKFANGGSFVRDNWRDAEKSPTNPDDDWLCWAAAASNILDWAGWNTPMFGSSQDMFAAFQNYWTNAGGLMEYGWHWWFDGTQPPDWPGWAQLNQGWSNTNNDGGYWSGYNFFDYYAEDWATWNADAGQWSDGAGLMSAIDEYLNNDYGVTLAVYTDAGSGHALTAWGYEYDEFGDYTGVYVTDSDDYQTALKLLPVTLDAEQGLWYLGGDYSGWRIGGVEGLALKPEEPPVPEPGTLLLFGTGLIGMLVLARKTLNGRK